MEIGIILLAIVDEASVSEQEIASVLAELQKLDHHKVQYFNQNCTSSSPKQYENQNSYKIALPSYLQHNRTY